MAEIYVAEMALARQMRRRVALKRIHPHLADGPEFVSMFLDEARVCSQLVNPGIVPVLDAVECEGDIFLVLEYVPGWDLAALFTKSRESRRLMPLQAAIHVAHSLASTLSYVHDARDIRGEPLNIVHRDISPSNILLAEDGSVRLLDFGVARAAARLTRSPTNTLKGKFGYMAPEQIRGRSFDRRADLYALGLVTFEMVTSLKAIAGHDDVSRLERARNPLHVPAGSIRQEISRALDGVIARLLALDPSERPATAAIAADAFERAGAELGGGGGDHLRRFVIDVMKEPSRPLGASSTGLDMALAKAAGLTSLLGGRATSAVPLDSESVAPTPYDLTGTSPLEVGVDAVSHIHVDMSDDLAASTEVTAPPVRRRGRPWLVIVAIVGIAASVVAGVLLASGTASEPSLHTVLDEANEEVKTASQGFLRISSEPPGAKVVVDSEPWREATPTIVESPSGMKRMITVELDDHVSEILEVSAKQGETTPLQVKLGRVPARLIITSSPEGAVVAVDGQEVGETPLTVDDLPRTKAQVTLTLEDHATHRATVRFDERSEVELDVALTRRGAFGLLDVSSEPWARVKVGGRVVAESTPALGIRLPVGSYAVTLDNPRLGLTARRRVTIRAGKRSRLVVRLR